MVVTFPVLNELRFRLVNELHPSNMLSVVLHAVPIKYDDPEIDVSELHPSNILAKFWQLENVPLAPNVIDGIFEQL